MTLNGVAASRPDGSRLFDDLTLAFGRERTGVVGRNGVGKTRLLRLVAGLDVPLKGTVSRVGTIGWFDQDRSFGPDASAAVALGVAEERSRLRRILDGRADADDLDLADWSLEARLDAALVQCGLSDLDLDRAISSLSGGEQTRLRLAGLLLQAPDLLVLDEPTNHLDTDGRAMVRRLLENWKGGAVVVSHDRTLLRGMDRIIELSNCGAETFGGGYDLYQAQRAAQIAAAERDLDTAERQVASVRRQAQVTVERRERRDRAGRAFAARGSEPRILLGARAERAEITSGRERRSGERQLTNAITALESARERVQSIRQFDIPMPPTGLATGRAVVRLDDAVVATGSGLRLLGPLSLHLVGPERIAVTGPNGSGKSTLLGLIGGRIAASSGAVERPVASECVDQHASILGPTGTLVEAYLRLNPEASLNQAQAALARFLFRNAAAARDVSTLSGGERLRAALACVLTGARPPPLLLLDEPTNHLDLDSIAAVEAALARYDGALVVVSHDADFLEAIGVTRRIALTPACSA